MTGTAIPERRYEIVNDSRQHPPRTRAVAALDLVLDALTGVRRLVLAPARLVADPRAGRLMTRGVIIAAAIVVVGTGLLIAALLRAPDGFAPLGVGPDQEAEAERTPGPGRAGIGPNSSAGTVTPTPRPSTPATTGPAAPPPGTDPATPGGAALTATYRTEQVSLVGYRAAVAISNPGRTAVDGWTVVITLPRQTLTIADVRGATATRDGATWTFQPDQGTRRVPAHATVQVSFRVDGAALGATAPTGCTVNGQPCEGEFPSS